MNAHKFRRSAASVAAVKVHRAIIRHVLQSNPSLHPSASSLSLSSPLQLPPVLVCSVPPGSLTLLRYLFVFCTASLRPQTSPSPPTPYPSSFFFFFFFLGFHPRFILHLTLSPSRSAGLLRGPPNQLFFLPVTVQISIPETLRGRWGCGPFIRAQQCFSCEHVQVLGQYTVTVGLYDVKLSE